MIPCWPSLLDMLFLVMVIIMTMMMMMVAMIVMITWWPGLLDMGLRGLPQPATTRDPPHQTIIT